MGPRPISSRKQIRAQALTVQNGTDQWQGADWVSHGMRDDGDFLTLMEGGKPHLTKLFRCIGENLITFGHLNENRMWLEPIRPAASLLWSVGPCAVSQPQRAAREDPARELGGVFRASRLDFRRQESRGWLPDTWFPGTVSKLCVLSSAMLSGHGHGAPYADAHKGGPSSTWLGVLYRHAAPLHLPQMASAAALPPVLCCWPGARGGMLGPPG